MDKILRAAGELIHEEGFGSLGTGRIAARAGVNIASLYQYFPNRDSILFCIYDEVASLGAQKLNDLAIKVVHDDLESIVPKILKFLLEHYEQNATILLDMGNELPEIRRASRVVTFESIIRNANRLYLQHHPEFRAKDAPRHLFFLENLVVSNLRRFVSDPPAGVKKAEFLTHLSRIIIGYLKGELS